MLISSYINNSLHSIKHNLDPVNNNILVDVALATPWDSEHLLKLVLYVSDTTSQLIDQPSNFYLI